MDTIKTINAVLTALFFLCYAYQFFYIPAAMLPRKRKKTPPSGRRYAVLISARNEEQVIGNLIASLRSQTYDQSLLEIFVVADNCTDGTARVAAAAGARVFERFDLSRIGKGYALQYLLDRIDRSLFDGFFVFDADNVLDEGYIAAMDRTFSEGYPIVTSYRNSKNCGDNWISAGYALWFLRESRYLNGARMRLGTSCAVSGTGFLFSRETIEETGGWDFFLLTEDIEFTVHHVCAGKKIGFCADAVLYDEQPVTFHQSWRQRLRWARGYLQVFGKYGTQLLRGILHGSFGCFDMTMNIMPAAVLSVAGIAVNGAALVLSLSQGAAMATVLRSAAELLLGTYLTLFAIGAITTVTEWQRIYTAGWKKVLYAFTFPLFMLTYIPISLTALFTKDLTWKPIEHNRAIALDQIRRQDRKSA